MESYFIKIRAFLRHACEPTREAFPNELDRKLQFKRNQNFLVMQTTFLTLLTIFSLFVKEKPTFTNYWIMSIFFIIIVMFFIFGRTHPRLFKILYATLITIAPPTALYQDPQGITACWVSVSINPILLLSYSGCHLTYFFQVAIQLFVMGSYYKDKMIEAVDATGSQGFMRGLTASTMFAITVNSVMTYHIAASLINTFKQEIILAENQRKELEVQKTFILSFSHEIRNLINTLTGNIQLSLLDKGSSSVKGYLEDAEIGAGLLLQLINNILDTGNLEVGELDINQSNQVIHNTLEKMWRMCAYLLKAKNLKGRFRIVKNIPRNLKLDHERFMQILINLIVNAVKFTDKGSVDVELEWVPDATMVTEECFYPSPFDDEDEGIFEKEQAFSFLNDKFTIIGLDKKKWSSDRYNILQGTGSGILKIAVTDTGCGVLPDNLPYAFHRFSSQIFGDKDSKKLGTTIGLYVTKELCNKMGGDIKIFSKIDRGTSFIACIPAEQLLPNALIRRSSTLETTVSQEQRLRAMIVDDLHFNIVVLTSYLERMKLEVTNTAINGKDAFNKYVESAKMGKKFDIVTMDVEMPVMDGKEAARKIRDYEREHNLEPCFLVMISGNVCESEISQCLRYNGGTLANHFLKKPATFDDVFRLINEHFFLTSQSSIASIF